MSLALITLELAKIRLGILHNDDDSDLEFLILAASSRIVTYLDTRAEAVLDLDSSGELPSGPSVPAGIEAAMVYFVGVMYRNRDGAEPGDFQDGNLPGPVLTFLKPFREPPFA